MDKHSLLCELLSGFSDKEKLADALLLRFSSIGRIFSSPKDELLTVVPESVAAYIKLLSEISKRRITERFKFPKKYTESEICEYLCALFLYEGEESAYALLLDIAGRVIFSERISRGVTNYTAISCRKITELCLRRGASAVILAHNHPFGTPSFSEEDIRGTELIAQALFEINVKLLSHAVFAGREYSIIRPKKDNNEN